MEFIAHLEVFERFPGLRLAGAVAHGLDNATERREVEAAWQSAWERAGAEAAPYGNAQSHPCVRPWRARFTAMGISGKQFPSSIESMLRRAMKGGEPFTINPLVDFYNTVSLMHTVPAGAFDLRDIHGPLELRLTHVGDRFTALDEEAPIELAPGEIAYVDGGEVLTRHFVWRQARRGLVSAETRNVFLISEILGEVGPEVAAAVERDFRNGLDRYFGLNSQSFVLDAEHPRFAWE
jgi:DNA/RNA-binding domain of Phe-tRNA-synthetase-like protein